MALKLSETFSVDTRLASEGVVVYFDGGPADHEHSTWVRIARLKNPGFREKFERLMKPHRARIQAGIELPEAVQIEIMCECMSTHVVLDWGGWLDDDGNELPYSPEAAKQLLLRVEDFRDNVLTFSQQQELFRVQNVENVTGN